MFQAVPKICAELVPPIRATEADVEMVLDVLMKLNTEYEGRSGWPQAGGSKD